MPQTAASLMTENVVTARPDDPVAVAAKLLSEGDLMRPFGQKSALRRDWWLNLLAEGTDLAPQFADYIRQDKRPVRELMTSPVITAQADTSLAEVVDLLLKHRIKRVPIVRDGKMVGILSRADVVRGLTQAFRE